MEDKEAEDIRQLMRIRLEKDVEDLEQEIKECIVIIEDADKKGRTLLVGIMAARAQGKKSLLEGLKDDIFQIDPTAYPLCIAEFESESDVFFCRRRHKHTGEHWDFIEKLYTQTYIENVLVKLEKPLRERVKITWQYDQRKYKE